MPNIFGKSQSDYEYLGAINDAALLDAHNAELKRKGSPLNFQALRDAHNPLAQPFNDVEANAQAVGFVTNNLQAIQAEIEEILYLDFRLDEFFPMVTNIPEGAKSYSYRVVDRVGQGSFIENGGSNANSAQTALRNVAYNLEYGGIIPEWTLEDLRRATFGGVPLDSETVRAGTEGAMDHIEQVGLLGDANFAFEGLTNHSGITTAAAAALWSTLTSDALVAEIQAQVTAIVLATEEIFGRVVKTGMTLYLPIVQADLLLNKGYGDNRDKSVWDYVRTNNIWTNYTGKPLELKIVAEMSTAGAGSTARALFGFKDTRVMEMAMPIAPRVITTVNKGYSICTPMEYKVSGLNVKRPTAMRYLDNI